MQIFSIIPQRLDIAAPNVVFAGLTITGNSVFGLNSSVFQPTTDSTTFFQVLDADGGAPILNVDSVSESVGVGTADPLRVVHVETTGRSAAIVFDRTDGKFGVLGFGIAGGGFFFDDTGSFAMGRISSIGDTTPTSDIVIASTGKIGFNESDPETFMEWTTNAVNLTFHNSTHTDADGGRSTFFRFKGEQSGGEETVLAFISVSHDGAADDQKGKIVLSVNDGDDGDTPSQALEIGSDLAAKFTGAVNSATLVLSTAGPTDNLDVSGVNTIFVDTSSNNVTLGGTVGGVDGQALNIIVHDKTNNFTIENEEGTGNQDFFLHAGGDETMTAEYGGWVFVNDSGTHWHDCSHAKHV